MPGKVLVVDDEASVCKMVAAILASAGMIAETTSDSDKAQGLLDQQKFDAIFLDVRMPSPDGFALAQRVRRSGFNRTTPIVMMTGAEDPTMLAKGFEAGASFFLFKPIDGQRLLRVVRASQASILREKRRFQRVNVSQPVCIQMNHAELKGKTVDISLNGLLVHTTGVFPIGSRVQITMQLVAARPPFRATGQVVRLVDEHHMGIQLQSVEPRENERLQEFLLPHILGSLDQVPA